MSNSFLDLLKPSTPTPIPSREPLPVTPQPNSFLNILKNTVSSIPVPTISQSSLPKPKAMEFRVGEGLSPEQTKTAYNTISNPDAAMNEAKANSFLGILKNTVKAIPGVVAKEFTPRSQAVPVRRAFEKEPIMTKAPPILTQAASFGNSLVEMIPKAFATIYGETVAPDKKTGSVNIGINAKRLGFEGEQYSTASKEVSDRIAQGEDPFIAALNVASNKVLDVAIGAGTISSIFRQFEKQLLKGGVEAQNAAWEALGNSPTVELAEKNKAEQMSKAFQATKNLPLAEREKALSELNNTLNKSLEVLKTNGIPDIATKARVAAARGSELVGRETDIAKTPFLDILKPDVALKPLAVTKVPIAGELPGYVPKNPKQQPIGLSTEEVKPVGFGEKSVSQETSPVSKVDKYITEGKIRVVSRDGRDVYQYQKAGEWQNARDEDSAIKQVEKPKYVAKVPELPKDLNERKIVLDITKEQLDLNPAKALEKYYDPKLGGLPEVGVNRSTPGTRRTVSKWKREGDQIASGLGFADSETARQAFDKYLQDKRDYRQAVKDFNEEKRLHLQEVKKNPVPKTIYVEAKPKSIPLIETKTGEGRSLEIAAEQELQKIDEPFRKDISSLPTIISQSATSVKQKINLLDYLRTPDRVLKKIGFANEASLLRKSYDEYLKELPKNIQKITDWSKRVSKEANKNIFKYLDGEAITLKPEELKVAEEIKDWLKEWATRLGLPIDNQIGHYITHIFDKELLKKEFDEDLAKIIGEKLPGQVYDPFLEKRLGAKGYKQDTWAALDAYVKRATRKVHMDPALEKIKEKAGSSLEFSNIEASQFKYLQRYINGVNMRPTDLDNLLDNTIKNIVGYKYGQRPLTYITKLLRQMTFRGMLGLNIGSALRNISQGINTYAKLGNRYTALGYLKLFQPSAIKELEREGVLNSGFIQDRALSSTKKAIEKIDKGLFLFFDTAEKINRGSAYFGAKSKALAQGKTEEQAIEYAKKIVRDTQFAFGSVDTPVALQSDIVKTLSQFQTFTVKQLEFLGEMAKDKNFAGLLRYAFAGLVFVYTVGRAFGMKPEEIIPAFRFGTPPSLKFPVEVTKAALNTPDKFGQPRSTKQKLNDIGNAGIGLIPAGSQGKKTLEGIKSIKEGGVYDKGGKLLYEQGQTKAQKLQSVLFGKYASSNAQEHYSAPSVKKAEQAPMKKVYDEVVKLQAEGKIDEAQAIIDELPDADYEIFKDVSASEARAKTIQLEKDIYPTFMKIKSLVTDGKTDEAQKLVDGLSDSEYKAYEAVLKKEEKKKPNVPDGTKTTSKGIIDTALTYGHAIGVDPVTAFNRIFTGQRIRRVDNGAIIVERMSLEDSENVKKERGSTTDMRLDHTIPLELGGSNSKDNLKLVSTADWASYTPVENYLANQLTARKISKKEAQRMILDFKNGKITAEEIYAQK